MRLAFNAGDRTFACTCLLVALASLGSPPQNLSERETHGIVIAYMDRSVKPGDDFYHYANGGWIKRTELPPNRNYIDPYCLDDDYMDDLTCERITGLIEEAAKADAHAGSNTRKIADLYGSAILCFNPVPLYASRHNEEEKESRSRLGEHTPVVLRGESIEGKGGSTFGF
jgi:Peptidase family M13